MILIFSIILMCSYLYSVFSSFRVLKNIYFKELLSLVASKYGICNIKNNTQELNYVQCSIIAPLEKALWTRWNIPSQFIAPMKKSWFYERLFFEVIVMVKDKKIRYKRYDVNQNQFQALHEMDKSNVTSSFRGIWNGLYFFFATFCFSVSLSIGKRSTLAKIQGDCSIYGPVNTDEYLFVANKV